jgi:hypothetical protein
MFSTNAIVLHYLLQAGLWRLLLAGSLGAGECLLQPGRAQRVAEVVDPPVLHRQPEIGIVDAGARVRLAGG